LEPRSLARFESLPSDTTKIRLTVFFKCDAIYCNRSLSKIRWTPLQLFSGLEVAALVSAEAFVIFHHSVGRHISEDSN
jgi:hypothetical protein